MSDILCNNSVSLYAPLSGLEVVGICKRLQDLRGTDTRVQAAHEALATLDQGHHALHALLSNTITSLDTAKKDLGRTHGDLKKTQSQLGDSCRDIRSLQEANKVKDLALEKLTQDLSMSTNCTQKIRAAIEKQLCPEIDKLKEHVKKNNHKVQHLEQETGLLRNDVHDVKEECRGTINTVQGLKDRLVHTNSDLQTLNERLGDTNKALKEARSLVDDSHTANDQMAQDQDHTRNQLNELVASTRKVAAQVRQIQESHDRTVLELESTQGQLNTVSGSLGDTRQNLQQVKLNVQSLKDGQDATSAKQAQLLGQLEHTKLLAQETSRGLHQTNNLVLPNLSIGMDTPVGPYGASPMPSPLSSARYSEKHRTKKNCTQRPETPSMSMA